MASLSLARRSSRRAISIRDGEAVLQRGAVRFFGFFKKFGDLVFSEFNLFFDPVVAHHAVLAGIGKDFTAISRDGEFADFEDVGDGRELKDLVEAGGEEGFVLAAKFAD